MISMAEYYNRTSYPGFYAVGPGKQIPPHVAAVQGKHAAVRRMNSDQSEGSSRSTAAGQETDDTAATTHQQHHQPTWRLRDAAIELMQQRSSDSTPNSIMPIISGRFDSETALRRIRRDKAVTVRQAFHGAATAVLDAIRSNTESSLTVTASSAWRQDLPLQPQTTLEALRNFSLERSYENKEYTKRKGGKTDSAAVVVAAAKSSVPPRKTASAAAVTTSKSSSSSTAVKKEAAAASSSSDGPPKKFTRNTPASSAAALDFRFKSARAILCVAGNLAFQELTPAAADDATNFDALAVPQNAKGRRGSTDHTTDSSSSSGGDVNMGAVMMDAKKISQRTISVVQNAVRRAELRYQYRKDCAADIAVENPFSFEQKQQQRKNSGTSSSSSSSMSSSDEEFGEDRMIPYQPNPDAITNSWQSSCLPRFLSVLNTGAGHAVYHDVQWSTRHGRIADLLRALTDQNDYFGPHLILTTEPELTRFAQEFHDLNSQVSRLFFGCNNEIKSSLLHALTYNGSRRRRRRLRKYFPQATGLPEAPFHVLITSYSSFLEDYLHFCQIPFEAVILDDGAAWMGICDNQSQNSSLGNIWENALFASNDHHVGLAGTSFKEWDYSKDRFSESTIKEAWIGLTARHRIMTASTFALKLRQSTELVQVSGLIDFVAPHFAAVAKEEWDRSRIAADAASMKHFRKLVARSVVVHPADDDSPTAQDMCTLALQALTGKLPSPDRSGDPVVPQVISDDSFVTSGKVPFSRRSLLQWLGAPNHSWLRYELGRADFQHILDAMKISNNHGFFCEEITTASSTTSSGATGQVAGTMAYRLAVRCGRHFGSEQGLRQHVSAMHAPPGTWLCRTCGSDCITSQARTHHERTCGQPLSGVAGDQGGSVGATPTVGQGAVTKRGVGKKKPGRPKSQQSAATLNEKDPDGSFKVPGYRGVWVDKEGKHFVKIDGKRLTEGDSSDKLLLFDGMDDAAKKYDEVVAKTKKKNAKLELNFKPDGSRIVYEDITPASTSGLGGSASNVVPALSVINIKDLPPDVKPLLRDPRQTSRTGGNSKRHVYAYRGVCRQARKGHDRWQSQISFMGVNHYLGTFDSEWDAAAIYAWAHLILYGEEATRQAQKEGEEAAAAYEQEKRDIAAGKIPEPPTKAEKKKKPPVKKSKDKTGEDSAAASKKRKPTPKQSTPAEKKPRQTKIQQEKEALAPTLLKAVAKAPIIAPREAFESVGDSELLDVTAPKIVEARKAAYCASVASLAPSSAEAFLRPCIPITSGATNSPVGGAMLLGLSPLLFGWDLQDFVQSNQLDSEQDTMAALQLLAVEYDEDGINERFGSVIQGTICVIGSANKTTQQMYKSLGLGTVPVGGSVGKLDCHIGGVPGSCSESAACIRYAPSETSEFQFSCLCSDDIVTLNGRRITSDTGSFPLFNEDICSVGARVFVFLLPIDK